MTIWRYTSGGDLDPTFGSGGWVTHNDAAGGNSLDEGLDLMQDASGRYLVTGTSRDGISHRLVIWRYLPDGTLDSTFDLDGWVVAPAVVPGEDYVGHALTLDGQGRILVTGEGYTSIGNFKDMMVWRFLPDGALDTSFGSGGWTGHHDAAGGGEYDIGHDITMDGLGRILVTGMSWDGIDRDMVIWRLNEDGTLDTSFDGDGWVTHNGAAGQYLTDIGWAIATDASGRILVAGDSDGDGPDMVIWRYLPDGELDSSFDSDGYVVHSNASGQAHDHAYDIALDAYGRIVVSGASGGGGSGYSLVVWRYLPDGTLDISLEGQGYILQGGADGTDGSGKSLAIDSLGRIVVTGTRFDSGTGCDMRTWRFCN
jgi:uncharacterized delta-60 repeat protein